MKNSKKGFLITLLVAVLAILLLSRVYYLTFYIPNISPSNTSLTDAAFIKAVNNPEAKILARGDINQDGYEDALVQELHCGASCSIPLDVVLNNKNIDAQLAVSDAFEPGYTPSSAVKSEITHVKIENGVISLTGYGLDCGNFLSDRDSDICTEENWHTIKTIQFKLSSTNGASKYYLERLPGPVQLMSLTLYVQDKEAARTKDCGITTKITRQIPKTSAVADASLKILFEGELAGYGTYKSVTISNGVAKVMLESDTGPAGWMGGLSSCEKGHILSVLHDTLTQYGSIKSVEIYSPKGKIEF